MYNQISAYAPLMISKKLFNLILSKLKKTKYICPNLMIKVKAILEIV